MALFNKEPEKNPKIQPTTSPLATPITSSTPPASGAQTAAGSQPGRAGATGGGEARAYLDRGSKLSGKVSFEGPARIDGEVDGEINAKDALTIGETAVVTAQIRAASVTVAGKVSGDIIASNRIEIRPSAKVNGNLTAPVLVVAEGALFEGHCSMQPEGVREDRKVTVFPKEERMAQAGGGQKQA
jgi:cytoskeletal protein CcmA (bactofilin family)